MSHPHPPSKYAIQSVMNTLCISMKQPSHMQFNQYKHDILSRNKLVYIDEWMILYLRIHVFQGRLYGIDVQA